MPGLGPDLNDERIRFANDVSLFVLDDSGVVFSESAQEIYQLNTLATFIWCRLEEGALPSQISRDLVATFGLCREVAEDHVQASLADWRTRGFLSNRKARLGQAAKSVQDAFCPKPKARDLDVELDRSASLRSYQFLRQTFSIGFETQSLEACIHPALSHLEVPRAKSGQAIDRISITSAADGYCIRVNNSVAHHCRSQNMIATYVLSSLFSLAMTRFPYSVAFHAGAVSNGRRALILPGAAGHGKTMLTAALIHSGWRFLSDDLVLARSETLELEGVPFPLCIKEDGCDLLMRYFPELRNLNPSIRPDGKLVRYLAPPSNSYQAKLQEGVKAHWAVFPRYAPEANTELIPMPRHTAIRDLVKSCSFSRPLTQPQVQTFVYWLRSVCCFELPMSSLEEALERLKVLIPHKETRGWDL